jgi:hypothetical protein
MMKIADEIYQRVQHLPDDMAREVLDFVGYLEIKYELSSERLQSRKTTHTPPSRIQENPNDVVWNDLLFNQPPRYK